jgi:hypothetical protein
MFAAIWTFIKGAWKAVAAAAAPFIAAVVNDGTEVVFTNGELATQAAVAALLVYLIPNRQS